ncbi:hypothetical protein [Actinomadura rifamycini]|uniref:hypothetical protein n=1 Tax=Actinomadura rifamycini TaxID=31962 RepID=UPI00041E5F3D|nr:hypothetical protein [Actinomadura rifamycini]
MGSDERVGYLQELERELGTRGLVARVVRTRSGPAFLRVVNPAAASLAEDVTCAPVPDGRDHYYWWSWGERMVRVGDPDAAARKLAHVLQPLAPACDLPVDTSLDRALDARGPGREPVREHPDVREHREPAACERRAPVPAGERPPSRC